MEIERILQREHFLNRSGTFVPETVKLILMWPLSTILASNATFFQGTQICQSWKTDSALRGVSFFKVRPEGHAGLYGQTHSLNP